MPVGASIGSSQIDNVITALAVNMRNIMQQVANLNMAVNGQGAGQAYLQSIGYSGTANPANPGGVSDAALALSMISYLNTMASIFTGTAQQTPAFNFEQELSQVWAGRVE